MMKKILLLLSIILLQNFYSQKGKDNYFPPSPEASALMKMVDVPVNLSTGVLNYSIPIHTIKLKNLQIPISLSYKSSGFKPSEIASEVGLGWDLIAGGKIIQNVVGKSDIHHGGLAEEYTLPLDRDFKLPSYLPEYMHGYIPPQSYIDSLNTSGTDYYKFKLFHQSQLDTQPDTFNYSLPNKSGKFYIANNGSVKQIPFGKEVIEFSNNHVKIVDTSGNIYFFELSTNQSNYSYSSSQLSFLNNSSNSESMIYYLTKIITPYNEEVNFIYEKTVRYLLYNDNDYSRYYNPQYGKVEKATSFATQINEKKLTKIVINNNYEINFVYNKYRKDIKGTDSQFAPKTLDEVKIKYENIENTFFFSYGYFNINPNEYNPHLFESSSQTGDTSYRLKLQSLKKDNDPPYVFEYFNEMAVNRFTDCRDHWGYYNSTCIRYLSNGLFDLTYNSITKEPNFSTTVSNILKSVTYPTKGTMLFEYELNDTQGSYERVLEFALVDQPGVYMHNGIYSNDFVIREQIITVPDNYIGGYVAFNLFNDGELTVTNQVVFKMYDDQNQLIAYSPTGTGNLHIWYNGPSLNAGKTYKLVLEGYDNTENESKYVKFSFRVLNLNTTAPEYSKVGGLRVKEIKFFDHSQTLEKRKLFSYIDNGKTTGILYEFPRYLDEYGYNNPAPYGQQPTPENGYWSFVVQHSRMPVDLFGFGGHHIFYKKVTENIVDTENPSEKIKTEKYFTFYDDLRYGDYTYFSKISYDWKRGLEKEIVEYKGNSILPLRKTIYGYTFLDTPRIRNSSIEPNMHLDAPTFPNEHHIRSLDYSLVEENLNYWNIYSYKSSKLISSWYYMNESKTEDYINGNILTTTTSYIYDNPENAQLSKSITKFPDNSIQETRYQYAHEKGRTDLINSNMISIPLETEVIRKENEDDLNPTIISKSGMEYIKKTVNGKEIIVPDYVLSYDLQYPNNSEVEVKYNEYDNRGNLLQYTLKPDGNGNGIPVTIIWGYNQTKPIAKIEGAKYANINSGLITSIEDASNVDANAGRNNDETTLLNALESFRNQFPDFQITTYTYDPLIGVRSVTPPSGIAEFYYYDDAGRLKEVKDANGNVLKEYQYHYKP